MSMEYEMTKTYRGSCHCGRVAFEAEIDLAAGTGRCNCSYCRKVRNWVAIVRPEAFRLTAGEAETKGYRFGEASPMQHCFCGQCGVRVFTRGDAPALGGAFISVFVPALDAPEAEIAAAPVGWADGLHNDWTRPPAETRHL